MVVTLSCVLIHEGVNALTILRSPMTGREGAEVEATLEMHARRRDSYKPGAKWAILLAGWLWVVGLVSSAIPVWTVWREEGTVLEQEMGPLWRALLFLPRNLQHWGLYNCLRWHEGNLLVGAAVLAVAIGTGMLAYRAMWRAGK
jgi:hypothetical protein